MKMSRFRGFYSGIGVLVVVVVVFLIVCVTKKTDANVVHRRHKHQANNEIPSSYQSEFEKEHKLLIECQHEDYRTYIKCLKREKRQHIDDLGGLKRNCLNECFETNCTTSACIQDCHRRCRTKLTYTKTVETTYDCNNGDDCKSGHAIVPNITTNIHIHNIMPNVTNCTDSSSTAGGRGGPGGRGGGGSTGGSGGSGGEGSNGSGGGGGGNNGSGASQNYSMPRIDIHNEINNHFGSQNQDCPCPNTGCNCNSNNYPYNPWQAMPQITIGFGAGPVGGCMYPWPCFPRYPQPQSSVDCSMCYVFQYRCDPACSTPGKNNTQSTTTQKPTSTSSYSSRRQ